MSKYFIFLLFLFPVVLGAQRTLIADDAEIKDSLELAGTWISGIQADTGFWASTNSTLPTSKAIFDWLIAQLASAGGGTLDTFAILSDTLYVSITDDDEPAKWVDLLPYKQSLTFDTLTGEISISSGNTIDLDGLFAKGSGSAATIPMWVAWDSLGNSAITQSGQEIAMGLTGALTVPSGTDAEVPVWGAGKLRYNTTGGGFQGGPSGYYLPWSSTDNWANGYVPYSDGNRLTASGNLTWNGSELFVNGSIVLEGHNDRIWFDDVKRAYIRSETNSSSTLTRYIVMNVSVPTHGGNFTIFGQNETEFLAQFGRLLYGDHNGNKEGVALKNVYGPAISTPLMLSGFYGSGGIGAGGDIIIKGGDTDNITRNPGQVYIRTGKCHGTTSSGGHSFVPGKIFFQVSQDTTNALLPSQPYESLIILRGGEEVSGHVNENTIELYQLQNTVSGIRSLTMEGDTIKYRIENIGTISTSTDASGDITVAHGMGVTPTSVQVTVTGTTPYVVTVHSIDATNFTVRFYDMTGAALTSTAVTATWHAKT